ncbi:branched-chain alpha-keto acid dehydrogenase subunit E2 [Azoarcus sp. DD4]|uniref:dihydrolipoamide acetyltransferase family protein n=1 Tax=Azoarcus sp. DD4 TaxID=2027405 RepID=UPI00112608A9|nr:dihydrolipoamide acetyltransferase family protein [Azoarcus sp. DD4]QDF96521.1 branched-chain alpha-keto acid dehydrogenase subunit E2 [Azoarcus sp. DD4]
MFDFKLPSLGADMDEGRLLEWLVRPGDAVKKGQAVVVVDTAKAAVDVEIWQDGTMHELLVQPGEKIPVGTVLAIVLAPGEKAPAAKSPRAHGRPSAKAAPAAVQPISAVAVAAPSAGARLRISPAARRRAEQLGVALAGLQGSGPDGAVTLADVERAAAAAPGAAEAAPAVAVDRIAETRRAIAAAMSRAKREIPHYYLFESVPLARAQAWLAAANADRPITARLLMAVLQLKAVALAAKRYPEMNGWYRDGGFEPAAAVHIGVAISLRQGGLIAPALHEADAKPLGVLMAELGDLVKRARAGSLRSSEMRDPSITVTNLGDQGVEAVLGVIHPPQVALVGFGRIAPRPWVEDGVMQVVPVVTASLAADHRVSDGHRGARFLAEVRELLQRPEEL